MARLASVDPNGAPHVVPVCPVLDGERILIASDPNAKIRFLRENPRCAVVFDSYVEEWNLNHQVQIRGTARIFADGPDWERAKALLDEKFRQYEPMFPLTAGETLMVEVTIERVTSEGFPA